MADGESAQYNCGTGHGHSVKQVVEEVERISRRKAAVEYGPRRQGDAPELVADARLIREKLGWEPRYSSLETVVGTAWRWATEGRVKLVGAGR